MVEMDIEYILDKGQWTTWYSDGGHHVLWGLGSHNAMLAQVQV